MDEPVVHRVERHEGQGQVVAWDCPIVGKLSKFHVSLWLLRVPGAHAFWQHWFLGVISLKDAPGVPPAHKTSPEMTHELSVYTINPESCPHPSPHDFEEMGIKWPRLTPPDHQVQFQVPSDRQAKKIADMLVKEILDRRLSPDQDYRQLWKDLIESLAKRERELS